MAEVPDPDAWGIAPGHHHINGDWVPSPDAGVRAALDAMGADEWAPPVTPTWVISRNWGLHVPFEATLQTEDGGSVRVAGHVPREDLPLGYHWLQPASGEEPVRLIVSPGVCPLPRRTWGWAVQLYAARSRDSWGIGDLGDLRRIAGWSKSSLGGGAVLINPLHAAAGDHASPYFPASRQFRNPIYLRVEDVPGAPEIPGIATAAAAGKALNDNRRINRAEVWKLKRRALTALWEHFAGDTTFDAWVADQGSDLATFATWTALAEVFGPDFRTWPVPYRRHDGPEVAEWAERHRDDVRFAMWLQWLVELQWRNAGGAAAIVTDVAIGCDPGGADAWRWQDLMAQGVTVGAPPDEFNGDGQDWGVPPFDPWKLRAAAYEPFAQVVRAALAPGGGVRIDHIAGLFRMFWVPAGVGPAGGVYVRYPWEDLLNVLALEADRAGAFVVGEDLGTVEPAAREALRERQVLSCRLLWFEDRPPAEWPDVSMAAVTTHDLPTVAGVWSGEDAAARRAAGLAVDAEPDLRDRLARVVGPDVAASDVAASDVAASDVAASDVAGVVMRAYGALAASPALLVTGTLDDALGVTQRPNMPGTVDEWPNWSIALPESLEEIELDRRVNDLARVLGTNRGR